MAMQANNVSQQSLIGSASASTPPPPQKELGKEDFLTLLVTQMRHQDPLSPMDSVQFTSQLAQFSSLEQMFGMNEALGNIQDSLGSQAEDNLLAYIGKTVKTDDSRITLKDGQSEAGLYALEDRAYVTIDIRNADGAVVRTMEEGWKDPGEHPFQWDGRNNNGLTLNDGIHTFEVRASDEAGSEVYTRSYISGKVTGVTYENSIPYLIVGDKWVAPNDIISISQTDQPV
jgi:flagellar basal-body rod modification protein FlgD